MKSTIGKVELHVMAQRLAASKKAAEVVIAETGGDMSRFRTAGHLASWAGVCPGHYESAGKRKSGKIRHGNRWLGAALGTAAMAASRTKDKTYLGARYHLYRAKTRCIAWDQVFSGRARQLVGIC
jgi:transposase